MVELKTLKDIDDYCCIPGDDIVENIGEEAIKWIKEDQKDKEVSYEAMIKWMKRLNITEDDLMTNEEVNAREHGEVGAN